MKPEYIVNAMARLRVMTGDAFAEMAELIKVFKCELPNDDYFVTLNAIQVKEIEEYLGTIVTACLCWRCR